MRSLFRIGVLGLCCLVACWQPTSELSSSVVHGGTVYRVDLIAAPEGMSAVAGMDINDHGQVACAVVGPSGQEASIWSARASLVILPRIANADYMSPFAINARGQVAGNAEWQDGTSHPVLWLDATTVQDLGVYGRYSFESPEASWSVESAAAYDINDRGHVVGVTSSPEFGQVAYLWTPEGGMTILGTLGGPTSVAWGVNEQDDVVGTSDLPDGTAHAFLWSNGSMTDLGALDGSYSDGFAIADSGEVTGSYQRTSGESRVFRWTRSGGMVDVGPIYAEPADGATSASTDINAVGQIVGGVQPPGQSIRAAVRQPASGAWQELSPGSPYPSFALGVNDLGVIVGHVAPSSDPDENTRAAVWTPVNQGAAGSP
jgi:probable HAF family extracellular repeat protein